MIALAPPTKSRTGRRIAVLMAGAALAVLAIFTGLLSTTANPIMIGVFIGLIGGVALLARPDIALWIVVIGCLLVGGPIFQFAPRFNKAVWLFSVLGLLLFFSAILRALSNRESVKGLPWFAWLALAFPVYALIVTIVNTPSLAEFLAGFKRYFQYWGVFAALVLIPFSSKLHRYLVGFVLSVGLLQVFFAIYQRLVVVPTRVTLGRGVVPIDAVTGTFEGSAVGGGASSLMAAFVLLALAFLIRAWRDKVISTGAALPALALLIAPLLLGETKIVIFFFPLMMMIVLQRELRRNPFAGAVVVFFGVILTIAFAYFYITFLSLKHQTFMDAVDSMIAYNFGNVGYGGLADLNRTTVLTFWWQQQGWSDPVSFMFGHGIGSSYLGAGSLVPGHLALRYFGIAIAQTGLATLLWDLGFFGMLFFVAILTGAWWATHRAALEAAPGIRRALLVAVEAGMAMNVLLLFYSDSMFSLPSHEVTLMLLLAAATLLVSPQIMAAMGKPAEHVKR